MAEVKVDLRITLDKLNQDLSKAMSSVKQQVNGAIRGTSISPTSGMSPQRMDELAQLRMLRAQGLRGFNRSQFMQRQMAAGSGLATAPLSFATPPPFRYRGATPPLLPGATPPGGGAGRTGLQALSASGIPYISTLARAVFSPLGVAAISAAAALQTLRSATNTAREMYAKQLRSGGLPGAFVSQRSALANIIGVSEQEVLHYGTTIAYLNDKLSVSSKIIADTTNSLAGVGFGFGIVMHDLKALIAIMVNSFAPTLRGIANILHNSLNVVEKWGVDFSKTLGFVLNKAAQAAITMAFGQVAGELFARLHKFDPGSAPNPQSNMKQLPASAWERMGLIIGAGGGAGSALYYQKKTAANTTTLVTATLELVHAWKAAGGHPTRTARCKPTMSTKTINFTSNTTANQTTDATTGAVASPIQQVTVGEFPAGNPVWARGWQLSNQYVFVNRGAYRVGFAPTDLMKLAIAYESNLSFPPYVTTQPSAASTTFAKSVLTSNGTIPSDGDTVTLGVSGGSKVYTFKTTLTPTEGQVLINGSATNALANLKSAIDDTGTPNTDYKCAAAHTQVKGGTLTATTLQVISLIVGTSSNSYASTSTASPRLVWGATTLLGGTAAAAFVAVISDEFSAAPISVATTYAWKESSDGTTYGSALTTTGIYNVATPGTLTITPTDTTKNGYYYRLTVTNSSGSTDTTAQQTTVT